jgi:hypothetical protein
LSYATDRNRMFSLGNVTRERGIEGGDFLEAEPSRSHPTWKAEREPFRDGAG